MDKWTLSEVVGFRVTRGVLASAERPAPVAAGSLIATGQRFVVLESINDYENLGAVFRNCAAFGVDAVLLDPRCADPLYRRSVRVSMGHVFGVGFAVLPEPWPASLGLLREAGVRLLAMTPRPAATALAELRRAGPLGPAARCRGAGPVRGRTGRRRRVGADSDGGRGGLAQRRHRRRGRAGPADRLTRRSG